ncbi:MAG: HD domain-containing protein [Polyangia bacterium]
MAKKRRTSYGFPSDLGEELAAAVEASRGRDCSDRWNDPVDSGDVREAFDELLTSRHPERGLEVLVRGGTMDAVLPEVQALVGFGEGTRHKDVWLHTVKVVQRARPRLELRWAALLHDTGKVPTRRFEPGGQVTFIGHPEVGARMFDRIARRIPFADEEHERIRFLIAAHLRASTYSEDWTDAAVRRFDRAVGPYLQDLLDLSRADITSKYAEKVRRGLRQIDLLARRIEQVRAADAKPALLPKGLGTALMDRFEIAPGPGLGRLMDRIKQEVEGGALEHQREHEYYLEFVERRPELFKSIDAQGGSK